MNLNSFLYRLNKFFLLISRNPLSLLKIFNIKKLFRAIKQLLNVQVSFKDLKKDYQLQTLYKTFEGLNYNLDNNFKHEKFLFIEKNIEELEKKYFNNEDCIRLKKLFTNYGSDKTDSLLVYIYFEIFSHIKVNTLFEIGLGTNNINVRSNMGLDGKPGASLRAFRDYLNINVYGADVDKGILFEEDKIKTYFIDQLAKKTILDVKKIIPKCDIIIDDGLHQPDANLNVIQNLLDHLNKNGILVVEDIEPGFVHIFQIIEKIFNKKNEYKASLIKIQNKGYCLLIQKLK